MGWTYNTVNPDAKTSAPIIAAVGITFTTVSFVVVALRMYVRGWMIKAIGIDDWIIVVTWVMSLGFMVVTLLQSRWGLGLEHLQDMPNENTYNFSLLQFIGAPFYISSILGFKLSLLFSFMRIAVDQRYRFIIIGITASCVAFHIAFLVSQINLCTPIAQQWDPAITYGSCIDAVPFYTTMASITILFDVIIMLTPFPLLIETKIPMRKKLIILGLFSLGTFITVIQIVRIRAVKALSNKIDSADLIMWSMVENNLGIIVASMPPLARLFRLFREKSTEKSTTGGSHQRGSEFHSSQIYGHGGMMALGSVNNSITGGKKGRQYSTFGPGDLGSSTEELSAPPGIHKMTELVVSREEDADDRYGRRERR